MSPDALQQALQLNDWAKRNQHYGKEIAEIMEELLNGAGEVYFKFEDYNYEP